jgi:hypothetical protein
MSAEDIRARIAALSKPQVIKKDLPTFGTAYFRVINAETRFEVLTLQSDQKRGLPASVAIAVTLCDENGNLAYPDLAEGMKALHAMVTIEFDSSGKRIEHKEYDELAEAALEVSGLGAKSLEDAEGKS